MTDTVSAVRISQNRNAEVLVETSHMPPDSDAHTIIFSAECRKPDGILIECECQVYRAVPPHFRHCSKDKCVTESCKCPTEDVKDLDGVVIASRYVAP